MHSSTGYDTRPLRFFLSQAVAITFEDAVIALAAGARLKYSHRVWRRIGYIWVYCWFVFSITPWMHALSSSGTFREGGMECSLILGLYRRGEWCPIKPN
jgi:hypothetical protein